MKNNFGRNFNLRISSLICCLTTYFWHKQFFIIPILVFLSLMATVAPFMVDKYKELEFQNLFCFVFAFSVIRESLKVNEGNSN